MIRFHGMRIGAYEVRVALLPAVAALLMLALLLSAGFWQLRRAEEKRTIALEQADRGGKQTVVLEPALAASASLEQLRHRRARAAGHYRGDVQYLLDNRIQNRAAGYHVLTPFRLQGSDVHLLVNRGWLPVGPDRGRLPAVTVSDKAVVQEGLIVAPPASGLALGASGYDGEGWPRVVQRVDLVRIREQLKRPLLPFVLRLSPASDHGYERDWRVRTGLTPERHLGYAAQWFALAGGAGGVVCLGRRQTSPGGVSWALIAAARAPCSSALSWSFSCRLRPPGAQRVCPRLASLRHGQPWHPGAAGTRGHRRQPAAS